MPPAVGLECVLSFAGVRSRMRRLRPLFEPLALLLAAIGFAAILWWPLTSIDRSGAADPGGREAILIPPPAWLLPLDDAYIFIRYAQQIARGRPMQWSDGERSTGASSWLYPWLLVPGHWLFDGLEGWSRWSSWVGLVSLWGLGLAAARLLRGAGLPRPWPTAAGLALVWCGPIGWVSIAGMDSALGAAAVVLACALWSETSAPGRSRPRALGLLLLIASLPLLRPDFAVLVGIAAIAILLGGGPPPVPRWSALLLPVPGLLNALLNWWVSGALAPGGVIAKSSLSSPYLGPGEMAEVLGTFFSRALLPVYLGLRPAILPPPIGWLAVLSAAAVIVAGLGYPLPWLGRRSALVARALRALLPLAVCWLALFAVAPLSGFLIWQHYRHHHSALACAWLLALSGLVLTGCEAWRRRSWLAGVGRRSLRSSGRVGFVLCLPALLLLRASEWSFDYFRTTVELYQDNGVIAEWLAEHPVDEVLLVHDAGLLAIAHDGPAVDVMGLGTTAFASAYRNGPGAVVEALARRDPLPALAAGRTRLFKIGPLIGEPVLETRGGDPSTDSMVLARVRRELLAETRLETPGIDFGHLPAERRHALDWRPPPWSGHASFAIALEGDGGRRRLDGCRPLRELLGVALPAGTDRVRLRGTAQPGFDGRLRIFLGNEAGPRGAVRAEIPLPGGATRWSEAWVTLPAGETMLWIGNGGAGVPCLESIAFF